MSEALVIEAGGTVQAATSLACGLNTQLGWELPHE